nr:uncharacterized protein LOC109729973 [Microcebus murinus]
MEAQRSEETCPRPHAPGASCLPDLLRRLPQPAPDPTLWLGLCRRPAGLSHSGAEPPQGRWCEGPSGEGPRDSRQSSQPASRAAHRAPASQLCGSGRVTSAPRAQFPHASPGTATAPDEGRPRDPTRRGLRSAPSALPSWRAQRWCLLGPSRPARSSRHSRLPDTRGPDPSARPQAPLPSQPAVPPLSTAGRAGSPRRTLAAALWICSPPRAGAPLPGLPAGRPGQKLSTLLPPRFTSTCHSLGTACKASASPRPWREALALLSNEKAQGPERADGWSWVTQPISRTGLSVTPGRQADTVSWPKPHLSLPARRSSRPALPGPPLLNPTERASLLAPLAVGSSLPVPSPNPNVNSFSKALSLHPHLASKPLNWYKKCLLDDVHPPTACQLKTAFFLPLL